MSARLRARLLEALKFRVLAAQESFFPAPAQNSDAGAEDAAAGLAEPVPRTTAKPPDDLVWFRRWLVESWPEALALSEADLQRCLDDARRLYLD